MQYTSKLAILAVALFSTSALAAPAAFDGEYELEAREADNELSAREFYDAYLEARADPALDARDLEAMDLEAREYLEYLEAREAASAASVPNSPSTSPPQAPSSLQSNGTHSYAKALRRHAVKAQEAASKALAEPATFKKALADEQDKLHKYAVAAYLGKSNHLQVAFADKTNPYHNAAKRIIHQRHAKKYFLESPKNLRKALMHRGNKYHKDAVRVYLSDAKRFERALANKHSRFHRDAVKKLLSDSAFRRKAIADENNPYHRAAVKFQKKLDRKRKSHGSRTASSSAASSTATPA